MADERKLIGEYLLENGIITDEQLKEAMEEYQRTNRKIGQILVRRGFAKEEDIAQALSEQLGFSFVDLATYQVEPETLSLISQETAQRLQAIPLFKVGESLNVAMVNPLDVAAIDELGCLTNGLRIKPLLTTPSGLRAAIDTYYGKKTLGPAFHKPVTEFTQAQRGFTKEEVITRALSEQLGFSFVDLATYQVEPEAASLISAETAQRLQAIPLFKVGESLNVAMVNPLDVTAIDELSALAGSLRIKPLLTTPSGLRAAIDKYYGKKTTEVTQPLQPQAERKPQAVEVEPSQLIQQATQASVINLVNQLIEEAVKAGASDIHLEPQEDAFYCRLRVDGILHDIEPPPQKMQLAVISRIKIMAEMDIAQSRLPQDGRIQTKVLGRDIDLRVGIFPTIYGEHASIRILDKSQGIIKPEELGFQPDMLKKFQEIIHKPYGMILVTGPTGSGKTTTIYAVLNTINDLKKNIMTLEDPVEYTIPRIHQTQVNLKAGLNFASGLRSIVRLDPDVIMIGEIRDLETAEIAIQASLTGHLVFSTLHTNDAPSAATRIIDIGVEPYLVSSSLMGVLAQRLVRRLCNECKEKYKPTPQEHAVIGAPTASLYKPVGCKSCFSTGYKGRVGIFELLTPDNEIRELIIKKAPAHQIKSAAQKAGMKPLRDDGLEKVVQGITSLAEVLRVTEEA